MAHGNPKIDLQYGWQNGPAWIELEVDELQFDDGEVGAGVILRCSSPTEPSGEHELELGTGKVTFPAGQGRLEFWLAASMAQVVALRDALTKILTANEGA